MRIAMFDTHSYECEPVTAANARFGHALTFLEPRLTVATAALAVPNIFSWVAWAPLAANGLGWTQDRSSPYLHLLGGLGPLVASVIVTAFVDGRAGLHRLLRSCISVHGRFAWVFAVAGPWRYLQFLRSHWAPGVKATSLGKALVHP